MVYGQIKSERITAWSASLFSSESGKFLRASSTFRFLKMYSIRCETLHGRNSIVVGETCGFPSDRAEKQDDYRKNNKALRKVNFIVKMTHYHAIIICQFTESPHRNPCKFKPLQHETRVHICCKARVAFRIFKLGRYVILLYIRLTIKNLIGREHSINSQ